MQAERYPDTMRGEYEALLGKVTSFTEPVQGRQAADMVCSAGCDSCCHAWLSPCQVEADALREALTALPVATRRDVAARGRLQLDREAHDESPPRCAMLDAQGECAVYDARPLVCRTQGHALRYPHGVIPASAVRKHLKNGEVTACELNFRRGMPPAADTVDAQRIDELLALVNARYCDKRGVDPHARSAISAIAAECDVLASSETDDDAAPAGFARNHNPR